MRLRNFLAAAAMLASGLAFAAAGGEGLENADINVHDKASLQRGAAMYVNYCLGCHSMQYLRYNRLVEDLDLSEEQVQQFLLSGSQEVSDPMLSAMDADEAEEWFGIAPPDLTLTARSRGPDWIYSYLKSFYLTEDGWNNTVMPNASMPHVLWELQGIQRPITESHTNEEGVERVEIVDLELDEAGTLSPEEYSDHVRDLVAFMEYAAEPAVLKREKMGIWVLLFLVIFTGLAWLLYQEYWKDVKK
ncbi:MULTISPECIES: cytochrome c1 [unclassified Wenzhouxiangella]|uniref:cytochrome c1 n=1 Tax=unclassified Wenzhouxiangella TaxID=2613841 RepID=UPI000E328CE7|nr:MULTISPECIES: cytochrome c1 [unclassified Wenzhouxiangella]RFF28956.1 cytochrome c1 [Wenzhouxiangella sp. 15181]RFP68368.1 cytochrome c1 [Wenzhouxiangella sp. 15190]